MSETVIAGSHRRALMLKKAPSNGWTRAQRQTFLDTLAVTANVTRSVAASGVSLPTAYKWRRNDAAFRAAWEAALEAGFSRLEEELLARALGDAGVPCLPVDGGAAVPQPFDPELALHLLRLRNAKGTGRPNPRFNGDVPLEELRRVLKHKLDMLAKRLGNTR